jgi:hypothetical protein
MTTNPSAKVHTEDQKNFAATFVDSLCRIAGTRLTGDIVRYIQAGKSIEEKVNDKGPFVVYSTIKSDGERRYKVLPLPIHDAIRLSGHMSRDYDSIYEAIKHDND